MTDILRIILLSTCIILNTAAKNFGQMPTFRFEHLQLPGGDRANFITGITQDSLGYMWFSTWNGLYRYDGYSFTNYDHEPTNSSSLSANWAETVFVDKKGILWIGTYGGGLNRFNPETATFTHFRNDPYNHTSISQDSVTVIMEDHKEQLWVGTMDGLNRMDRETGTFTRYMYNPDDSTSLSNNQVRAILEDRKGDLWVGTNSPFGSERDNPGPGGLNRFNRDTENFTRYLHNPNDPNTLASNHVMSLLEDSEGTLWVGTWNNGLHILDREEDTFKRPLCISNAPDVPGESFNELQPDAERGVTFIHEDDQGGIWIGILGVGLKRYDPETDQCISFESKADNEFSLSSINLWRMYQSKDGTNWISMIPGGLNKIHLSRRPFGHFTLTPMHSNNFINVIDVDNSGILRANACCPDNTIISFQPFENENSAYRAFSKFTISEIFVSAIEQTKDGTLWLGSHEGTQSAQYGGLYQMEEKTDRIFPVLIDSTNTGIPIGPIVEIYEDNEGILWFGTRWTGLFRFNRETGEVRQYGHDPEKPSSLSHTNITVIYETQSNSATLWIGTEDGGLNRFDKESEKFTRFNHDPNNPNSLSGKYITSIYEDASGHLFIGTLKSGLNWMNVRNNAFTKFTVFNSGLPDNNVSCILGDKNGNIWIGTTKGLTRFNPETGTFYTFGARHGVRAHPFVSSCDSDQSGNLIFAGINGFTVFNPDQVEMASSPSPLVLTSFILNGQQVNPDSNNSLNAPIWTSDDIRLRHNENTFSFVFALLDYRNPQLNQYTCFLEGYDQDWRDLGTLRKADYSRVPYGKYNFKVRAANSEGVWNREGVSFLVTILPPWWQTWWAYGLYILIFLLGVWQVHRFQKARTIRAERENAQQKELEHAKEIKKAYHNLEVAHDNLKATQSQLIQSEKMASLGELTAGIAHEIQNPLNFVNNFSEVNNELIEDLKEAIANNDQEEIEAILYDLKENESKVSTHGKRAESIVKGMLLHSRGSSGKKESTDINSLCDEYLRLSYHGFRAKDKSFNADYKLELDESLPKINVVPQDIGRVLLNLINNAFYVVNKKAKESNGDYKPVVTVSTSSSKSPSGDSPLPDGQVGVKITVNDNGPGIPEKIKEKIFQPFFSTKPTGQGTGLGLSMSYDIITKGHGGELKFETKEGEGSVFIISLWIT